MSEFEQLGIHQWLSKQCAYMALHHPTPIQKLCIPAILAGKCVVGGAATGSGKTASFALPLLQILAEDLYGVFALVLTPSRELAYQILDQFVALGAPLHIRPAIIIGGVPHEQQLDALKARPHVVVATPGRLKFTLDTFPEARKAFSHLRFLVLDEADRLTSGDIETDVAEIVSLLPPARPERRVLLFTATLEQRLTRVEEGGWLERLGMSDAAQQLEVFAINTVTTATDGCGATAGSYAVADSLQQRYLFIPNMVKLAYLVASLRAAGTEQSTIVFTNSCMRCEVVRLTLQLLGFPVCSLNSIISQKHRLDNLATFKLGIARILVATDIASRGLDIPTVGLVLHYDLPKQAPTYLHRVGRTARAGREGLSVAFVTEYDVDLVRRLEKKIKYTMTLWKAKGVSEKEVLRVLDEVSAAKVQAKLQVEDQFGQRVNTLKANAAEKRTRQWEKEERVDQQQEQQATTAKMRRTSSSKLKTMKLVSSHSIPDVVPVKGHSETKQAKKTNKRRSDNV
ncbi:putative ATP-dependent RNA helicase [Trypanosoma rangeli]|uniref:Probable eukaryotic initiation factor 4A n=1 Tax=Trypanosoma rangeli TaxID=5698 RepID=A0A422NDK5_TRYRA|nr:putative ATP-dependent RNA helicase [Trypanosoma rangeli]RNF03573.1 putative ATP-dependent RNA helicase [Trypanosoma rangeli]|eukprot:RNF03573.1 putative ATP-dependent RNA helicase [Trypanosoma rangeli]